jgi:hypothetical protein
LPVPDKFYKGSGEGVFMIVNKSINIIYNVTEERVLRVAEFPIRAHEVYSPPSGVHNGNAGYYLGELAFLKCIVGAIKNHSPWWLTRE